MARMTYGFLSLLLVATSCATSSSERYQARPTPGPSGLQEVKIEALGLE